MICNELPNVVTQAIEDYVPLVYDVKRIKDVRFSFSK